MRRNNLQKNIEQKIKKQLIANKKTACSDILEEIKVKFLYENFSFNENTNKIFKGY